MRIFGGELVARRKPAPDLYELAAAHLGLTREDLPRRVVCIEDSEVGLRAALAAGIRATLITKSTFTQGEDFAGASRVVADLEQGGVSLAALLHLLREAQGEGAEDLDG